jgi:hypothetical protein
MGNPGSAMGSGTQSNRVGRQDGGGMMDGTISLEQSVRQSNLSVIQTCVFFLSTLPPDPDFHISFGFSQIVVTD